jgi:hypothetical protein
MADAQSLTLAELKIMAYDHIRQINRLQESLRSINAAIENKEAQEKNIKKEAK